MVYTVMWSLDMHSTYCDVESGHARYILGCGVGTYIVYIVMQSKCPDPKQALELHISGEWWVAVKKEKG